MKPKIGMMPAYSYVGTDNKQVMTSFILNNELYERYKSYGGSGGYTGNLESWSGTYADPVSILNTYLNGIEIFGNHDIPFYVTRYANEVDFTIIPNTARSTEYHNLINKVNANVTELFYVNEVSQPARYTKVSLLNGLDFNDTSGKVNAGYYNISDETIQGQTVECFQGSNSRSFFEDAASFAPSKGSQQPYIQIGIYIYPEDLISDNAINDDYLNNHIDRSVRLTATMRFVIPIAQTDPVGNCTYISLDLNTNEFIGDSPVVRYLKGVDLNKTLLDITGDDPDNPYSDDDTSGTGGGDGPRGNPDILDPVRIPEIPSISAADLGFVSMYNPSVSQLKDLSTFLWSSGFDINNWKKLFTDPMEACIGLAIVPVAPTIGGSKSVKFGSVDSGISMPYLSTNYVKFDCGWLPIQKYIGSFLDFTDTRISIYLPYIGIRELSPDDVMGGNLHVAYIIDVLTGACACFIEDEERGVLYTYNGSCITNVPLTASNFSGAIQNAVSAVMSGIGMAAGMTSGAAPLTAMGAVGLLNTAANTVMNAKTHVERSGNLGGSAGIMSVQTPYVIIERPRLSIPYNMQHYIGQTSNIANVLGYVSGFTMVEYVHIENCTGTSEEIAEIESLLKQGVYL